MFDRLDHSASDSFSTRSIYRDSLPPLHIIHLTSPDPLRPFPYPFTVTDACCSPIPTTPHFMVQTYRHPTPLGLIRPRYTIKPPAIACVQYCYIMIYSSSPLCLALRLSFCCIFVLISQICPWDCSLLAILDCWRRRTYKCVGILALSYMLFRGE